MQVGVVDTNRVLAESKSGKAVAERLQRLSHKWQEQVALTEQRLEEAQGRVSKAQTPGQVSNSAFKPQHELNMLRLVERHTRENAQKELEDYSDFYQALLSQALAQSLDALGKSKGFSLILTGPNAQMPFVGEAVNITQEAIAKLDESFKIDAN